ncbi:MAG TPA: 23S rRNA (adenine(2030)-N(6))-methyltransferase RlmJ [Rhizomicrobium sp.]|jgi:23S rRNA (adenine2030-N6)-methyltransferase|nr:23S rRNA (adenine(2030)-N(6))-methyltransferase RlmJ [Rhizomicrobium sp.]
MNYRHAFHAGNFADVIKHVALVAVLLHLRRKEKPFCVIDTHAGAGLYDLGGAEAARTGEAKQGIAQLCGITADAHAQGALAIYLDCVNRDGVDRYPGSPLIAARLLRPQDRLVAIEKHPQAAAALRAALAEFRNARAVEGDGYERLPGLLPPPERRGVVLIDPPFEEEDEFTRAADAVLRAHRRFATGIYLLWYPVKSRTGADAFCGEVSTRGVAPLLRIEIDTGLAPGAEKQRLGAAGLLVLNPPFQFDSEMQRVAAILAPRLGRDETGPAAMTVRRT